MMLKASLGFVALFFCGVLWADPYNEVLDTQGKVRPEYQQVFPIFQSLSEKEQKKIRRLGRKDFKGDNELLPIPRVVGQQEYQDLLQAGVRQRGQAIYDFLADLVQGREPIVDAGLMPREVMEKLKDKYNARPWIGSIKPEQINFWYGPDVIRDQNGAFRVIEDNLGYVGGFGDLAMARESLLKRVPAYGVVAEQSPDPIDFYKKLAERYRQRNPIADSKTILVQYVGNYASDQEPNRFRDLMASQGIETVRVNHLNPDDQRLSSHLKVKKDGVYLVDKTTGKSQRVGMIIPDIEAVDLDPGHPGFKQKILVDEAKEVLDVLIEDGKRKDGFGKTAKSQIEILKKHIADNDLGAIEQFLDGPYQRQRSRVLSPVADLWNATIENKVAIGTTPFVDDFIGDKEFNLYMDKIVKFYSKKSPIIKGIPTSSFAHSSQNLDKQLYQKVFKDLPRYVIKRVDGRGGDSVWVGPKLTAEQVSNLQKQLLAEPQAFIAQEYLDLSRLPGHIVDLRILSEVGPEGVFVSNVPWGRAVSVHGDGKVNLSASGAETTVFVVPTVENQCRIPFSLLN